MTIVAAAVLCLVAAALNNILLVTDWFLMQDNLTLTEYGTSVFGGLLMGLRNHYTLLLPYLSTAIIPPVILGTYLNLQTGSYLYFRLIRFGDVVKWWHGIFLRTMGFVLLYALVQMLVGSAVFLLRGHSLQAGREHPELILLAFATFVLYMAALCSIQLHIQCAYGRSNHAVVYLMMIALPVISLGIGGFSAQASIWFPGSYGMSYRNGVIRQFLAQSRALELEAGWNTVAVFAGEAALTVAMYCLTIYKLKKSDRRIGL